MYVTALIPAHNEESSIAQTLEGILNQTRLPDSIVVVPNGCTDRTADVARSFDGVTVMELPALAHRKSEALNRAWQEHARDADVVICLDADTYLPPNAVHDWMRELCDDPGLGGSSSKFTVYGTGVLARLQKAEYAAWADIGLRRGSTSVLSGTGSAFRGSVLRAVALADGPWSYNSVTEDYDLTIRIRTAGYRTPVSPTVRAYTDSMTTLSAIWGQRMKWQVGTGHDLLRYGWSTLTRLDWGRQIATAGAVLLRIAGAAIIAGYLALEGTLTLHWAWLILPILGVAISVKRATRIPHRDWKDLALAASFFPGEAFMWVRSAWFICGWATVIRERATGQMKDHWAAQYRAEGMGVN